MNEVRYVSAMYETNIHYDLNDIAKEIAIRDLKENIEDWLVMDIYDENTDKYIEEGKHRREEA